MKTETQPLISVIIPFYNCASTILDSLRAVFAQSWSNWEVILLDDGSGDESLELVRRIKDERVRIFSDGVNRGVTYRRNEALAHVRGEFMALLDADDLMHPDRLKIQYEYLSGHPDCDLVFTGSVCMDAGNTAIAVRDTGPIDRSAATFLKTGAVMQSTVMGRTRWFAENPYRLGYDRAEDRELWVRTYGKARMERIAAPLFFYREVGVFSLPKFLVGYRSERRIIREYGPALVGGAASSYLFGRSLLKSLVISVLSALHMAERVISRRYEAYAALDEHQGVIDRILVTPLPGID